MSGTKGHLRLWAMILALAFLSGIALVAVAAPAGKPAEPDQAPGRKLAQNAVKAPGGRWTTVDHSKLEALNKEFAKPEELTEACLGCHSLAAGQIQHTIHWTWQCNDCGKDGKMGKNGMTINNYCIAIPSNEPRCTSCHIGYGWKDKSFDFTAKNKIDCLSCHDSSHSYKKFPTKAGYPVTEPTVFPEDGQKYLPPDYKKIIAKIGVPDRLNCGECHFYGGGGDAVKHGDLDSSMGNPGKNLDVHMDAKGQNFNCQRCHTTKNHSIAGRMYTNPAATERLSLTEADLASKVTCESCHSATPHKTNAKANDHTDKVACQACHIPEFAREIPTKMRWDWSTAGKKNSEGKPFKTKGDLGKPVYDTKKGDFIWAKNVQPEYFWYNGTMSYYMLPGKIDPASTVTLNHPAGAPGDPNSRIMPFKRHTGKQPYDAVNRTMVVPKLFGPPESDAYWAKYDWKKSITAGMAYVGLPFSGEYAFAETEYFFPTTHMVAPKEKAVQCSQCHSRDGRMKSVPGIYMPGRDATPIVGNLGWLAVIGSVAGVAVHGGARIVTRKRREK